MPIEREILNMFEFSRNSKIAIFVDNHFDEYTPSQGESVPTDRKTYFMHQYVVIESHRKTSVTLWVHPFRIAPLSLEGLLPWISVDPEPGSQPFSPMLLLASILPITKRRLTV